MDELAENSENIYKGTIRLWNTSREGLLLTEKAKKKLTVRYFVS